MIGTEKEMISFDPAPLGSAVIFHARVPDWCDGNDTVAVKVLLAPAPRVVSVGRVIVAVPDVTNDDQVRGDASAPELFKLKLTVNELELCKTLEGCEVITELRLAALAKPARSRIERAAKAKNLSMLDFILCCNSLITLVYKYFYS